MYVRGTSAAEDAVFVQFGSDKKHRVHATPRGEVVPARLRGTEKTAFPVTVDKDGPVEVVLTTAETNVFVDRIVFRPAANVPK